jgi:membrane protease YdiL (CAAX protease family)
VPIVLALGINVLLGNNPPVIQDPITAIFVFLILIVTAGLGEEIGWRGYASSKMRDYKKKVPIIPILFK